MLEDVSLLGLITLILYKQLNRFNKPQVNLNSHINQLFQCQPFVFTGQIAYLLQRKLISPGHIWSTWLCPLQR